MITYNDLYEILRKEKYSEQLQALPKKFLQEAAEYFENKKGTLKEDDTFSDMAVKNKKKLDNAVSNFRELLRLRKKKILQMAFVASEVGISKKDFENLLGFERDLFEDIVKSLDRAEKAHKEEMNGKQEDKYQLVRFLQDVPEFLNYEGEEEGPFEKGEVANLDKSIADILLKDGKVEIVED
ncbi:MAG: hypothetical protein ACP5D2_01395 [Candidatus Nanoarchaeia archaeon]